MVELWLLRYRPINMQWGNSSLNSFPISFSNTNYKLVGLMTASHYDYTSAVTSKSKTGFQTGSWGNPYDYIAIGT